MECRGRGRGGPPPAPPPAARGPSGPPSATSVPARAYSGLTSWKDAARREPGGYYTLPTEAGSVRIFMTPALFAEAEESLGVQIENARRFPGVLDVAVTPDAHHGYGVPVGCVMATSGTLAMGPVGYDIGCGIAALRSSVSRAAATPDKVKAFSRLVMQRVGLGAGSKGESFSRDRFQEIVRGGAEA